MARPSASKAVQPSAVGASRVTCRLADEARAAGPQPCRGDLARHQPAAVRVVPAATGEREPAACGRGIATEPVNEIRRQATGTQQPGGARVVESWFEAQEAIERAVQLAAGQQRRHRARHPQRAGPQQPCVGAVIGMQRRVHQSGRVARGRLGRRRQRIDHRAAPANARKCRRSGAAGQTGANDQRLVRVGRCRLQPAGRRRRAEMRRVLGHRHLELGGEAGGGLDAKAGRRQALAQAMRGAPGGQRGAWRSQARQPFHQPWLPHRGVARRREAVEVEGIDPRQQLGQQLLDVAEAEDQA